LHTQEEIDESKIELAEELKKLYKNKSFRKLILDGFLTDGATYLTKNLTKVKAEYEDDLVVEMKARSILWKYLDTVEEDANSILESRQM